MEFSLYEDKSKQDNVLLSVENYIGFIQHGNNQDLVLKARVLKQKGDEVGYKKLKNSSRAITGSAVYESGVNKTNSNYKYLNGNIIIDIDDDISEETYQRIKDDKHTCIAHQSFGGVGYCIFVKIDVNKFDDSFTGLEEYYYKNFDVRIDSSCKNTARLRYLSYDPHIYYNPKSNKFIPKDVKRFKEPKKVDYIFHEDDFDHILRQIGDRSIDLCQEDYFTYMRIGMALASKLGSSGLSKFEFICSMGSKYNEKRTIRDYNGFVKNHKGACTIGTFYYYCKQAGIDLYTEKTKTIINRVKIGKSQGSPTIESVSSALSVANNITPTTADLRLIGELIESKYDYSKEANEDLSEIKQLQSFIIDTYNPVFDVINKTIYINGKRSNDREVNDIYIACRDNFDFKVNISDVRVVLNSNFIPKNDALSMFFKENKDINCDGKMEEYARCIKPESDFNVWAFKKWLVGGLYNWTSKEDWTEASPLTFILTGQDHGTGKTSFFRNMLPNDLKKYFTQTKIDSKSNDSMFRLSTSLIVFDDEFGGEGTKNAKAYKATSDTAMITQRRPYGHDDDVLKRIALLCGTSNDVEVLMDSTGNRRILPANVEYIDFPSIKSFDTTALIMDAYNHLQSGFEWAIWRKEDIQYIKDNTKQNENVLPIEELFFTMFQTDSNGLFLKEVVMNQGEIMEYMSKNGITKPTKYEVKEVLIKNKMIYKVYRVGDSTKNGVKLFIKHDHKTEIPSNW